MTKPLTVFASLMAIASSILLADDQPPTPPKAARSVHLRYISHPATAFYAQVTVEKSVPGSYFQVCGFSHGYFGIQELTNGKKVGIFSVWDTAKGNDPKVVAEKDRVQTLFTGDGVRTRRFGGEGTGEHSDFDFDWKVGDSYRLYLTSNISGSRTAYSAYIFRPQEKSWFHVATFQAPDGGEKLSGLYSFIEDFRRDTNSATQVRRAMYGHQWVMTDDAHWEPINQATFTASGAPTEAKETINAGVTNNEFFLQTGGDTKMEIKLKQLITQSESDAQAPVDLPKSGD
jgi:hypothetical protein